MRHVLDRMHDCHFCRLYPSELFLEQEPAGILYQRGQLLPMERHHQHPARCHSPHTSPSPSLAASDKQRTESRTHDCLSARRIVSDHNMPDPSRLDLAAS